MRTYLRSIRLENIRCFGEPQSLNLADAAQEPPRWTLIFGGNGVGKTTLLQAICSLGIFVSDQHPERGFVYDWRPLRDGAEVGRLAVVFRVGSEDKESSMFFRRPRGFLIGPGGYFFHGLAIPIIGYGATRRLGRATSDQESPKKSPSATLFREEASLYAAEDWLLQSASPEKSRDTQDVRTLLLRILPDITDISYEQGVRGSQVVFSTPYGDVQLSELSLGYRTLIAWIVNLARRLVEMYPDSHAPLEEPAIVCIDEIDLHMHPRWQREITEYLSERFPNVQFIATAHSPLVAQSKGAKLVVLRRDGNTVRIVNNIPNMKGWRVDQLLISELFGLTSARPAEEARALERRRELVNKRTLSRRERTELKVLDKLAGNLPGAESIEDIRAMQIIHKAAHRLSVHDQDQ